MDVFCLGGCNGLTRLSPSVITPAAHSRTAARDLKMWIRLCHFPTENLTFKAHVPLCKTRGDPDCACLPHFPPAMLAMFLFLRGTPPACLGAFALALFKPRMLFLCILALLVIWVSAQISSSKWGLLIPPPKEAPHPQSHYFHQSTYLITRTTSFVVCFLHRICLHEGKDFAVLIMVHSQCLIPCLALSSCIINIGSICKWQIKWILLLGVKQV